MADQIWRIEIATYNLIFIKLVGGFSCKGVAEAQEKL